MGFISATQNSSTTPIDQEFPKQTTLLFDEFVVEVGNSKQTNLQSNQFYNFFSFQNPAALNDQSSRQFFLAAGNYTLNILGTSSTNRGISQILIDEVVQGTLDWYAAKNTQNVIKTLTVTVPSDGTHKLTCKASGKNVASTDYFLVLTKLWFTPV